MDLSMPTAVPSRWQAAGRVLTWLAAVSALAAAVSAISDVTRADDTVLIVQTWRMYGLFLCTGLFVLLALRPRVHGAVWALLIADKAALALTAAIYPARDGAAEAAATIGWDGGLAVVLTAAYLMSRSGARRQPGRWSRPDGTATFPPAFAAPNARPSGDVNRPGSGGGS